MGYLVRYLVVKPKPITLVMPYYDNAGMLRKHLQTWDDYPGASRKHFAVIIVDDGSPTSPAFDVLKDNPPSFLKLYRCKVDVRWNWIFCRNLAMSELKTDWALMTDIDHLLPKETLKPLLFEKHEPDNVYRLSRRNAPNGESYKAHPNTWFLTRQMFQKIGGYDERFSGYYGSDADFRERAKDTAKQVVMLSDCLIRYPREVIADASTTTYGRKEEQDRIGITAARKLIAEEGGPPRRLSYEWERLI